MPCLTETLSERPVTASAPHRLDVGGTWDLKALALPCEHLRPSTTNIAIGLRTRVQLRPHSPGRVRITDGEYTEGFALGEVPFDSRFGLLWAIVSHLQVHGVEIQLSYEAPPRAGLGGSGTLAVAVLAALRHAVDPQEGFSLSALRRAEMVELAHQLEDGLHFSFTGMQDQAAAAFGGVNRWEWRYSGSWRMENGEWRMEHRESDFQFPISNFQFPIFRQEEVLPPERHAELSARLAVAYVGQSHQSSDVNARQVADFFAGSTRGQWLEINRIAHQFAAALRAGDYEQAAALVQREHDIRVGLVPSRITSVGRRLESLAQAHGCGFAVSGAGNGGCVWALGADPQAIAAVREEWRRELAQVETAQVLEVEVDGEGVIVGNWETGKLGNWETG